MSTSYRILPHQPLISAVSTGLLSSSENQSVSFSESAEAVLTAFKHTRPFSITSTATIDQINDKMIACGVRLLFVLNADEQLHGIVTFTDIFGDKPVRYIQQHGGSREEIIALDILTPLDQLETLDITAVARARVGDIVETITNSGRQHLLVAHTMENNKKIIVGMFSSTQISKLTGQKIELSARANTFSDLGRALTE